MNLRDKSKLQIGSKNGRTVPKCPEEPTCQVDCNRSADKNGKHTSKRKRYHSPDITPSHWEYLHSLKDCIEKSGCDCGCEGNALECKSDAAQKYRNLRHHIFEAYRPYAEKIASISYSRRANSIGGYERMVSRSDAVSSALHGMLSRIDTYDCNNPGGASFMTYIFPCISNSVIDEMRILSDFPNVVAARKRIITETRKKATAQASRPVTDEELLEYGRLNYDDKTFEDLITAYSDTLSHKATSNQSVGGGEGGEELHDNIESACQGSELTLAYQPDKRAVKSSFNKYLAYITDERVRCVVALSYCSDLSASLISAVMEISPSLTSKMKKQGEDEIKAAILLERKAES